MVVCPSTEYRLHKPNKNSGVSRYGAVWSENESRPRHIYSSINSMMLVKHQNKACEVLIKALTTS